jgi:hypothetical protein
MKFERDESYYLASIQDSMCSKGGRSSKKLPLCCSEDISGKFSIRNLGRYSRSTLHSRVKAFYSLCADSAAMTKGIRR